MRGASQSLPRSPSAARGATVLSRELAESPSELDEHRVGQLTLARELGAMELL